MVNFYHFYIVPLPTPFFLQLVADFDTVFDLIFPRGVVKGHVGIPFLGPSIPADLDESLCAFLDDLAYVVSGIVVRVVVLLIAVHLDLLVVRWLLLLLQFQLGI